MNKSSCRTILVILAVFGSLTCWSRQPFKFQAQIDPVQTDGFYNIQLHPGVSGLALPGLTDVRILDDKGLQVPYVVQTGGRSFSYHNFVEFPLLNISSNAKTPLQITLLNVADTAINHLLLFTRSAETSRFVNLSGSDDNVRWFVLKEQIRLDDFTGDRDTSVQRLSFPETRYRYLRVTFPGKNLLPVNVVKAGVYTYALTQGSYTSIPEPQVQQTDSAGSTIVRIRFKQTYLVEKLQLLITGSMYYKRSVTFANPGFLTSGEYISSNGSNTFEGAEHTKALIVTIHNGDNPPIKVTAARAWTLNRSLLAYLKHGSRYSLFFGDSSLAAPEYDLAFFKDSIRQVATITTAPVTVTKTLVNAPGSASKPPVSMVWVIITVVAGLLLFFTIRLTREVGKRSAGEHN